jgi:guanine nucleotide-binding protein G(I)/G(S)/G(T) subunit beta-1
MSNDLTGEQMQAKITAARREAEGLKDRIKRKKDDLADTSCKSMGVLRFSCVWIC